jgi:hypothetical protein
MEQHPSMHCNGNRLEPYLFKFLVRAQPTKFVVSVYKRLIECRETGSEIDSIQGHAQALISSEKLHSSEPCHLGLIQNWVKLNMENE